MTSLPAVPRASTLPEYQPSLDGAPTPARRRLKAYLWDLCHDYWCDCHPCNVWLAEHYMPLLMEEIFYEERHQGSIVRPFALPTLQGEDDTNAFFS